jgi:hypothetical protein
MLLKHTHTHTHIPHEARFWKCKDCLFLFYFWCMKWRQTVMSDITVHGMTYLHYLERDNNCQDIWKSVKTVVPHHQAPVHYLCSECSEMFTLLYYVFLHLRWFQYHVPMEYVKAEQHSSSKPFFYILSRYWVLGLTS